MNNKYFLAFAIFIVIIICGIHWGKLKAPSDIPLSPDKEAEQQITSISYIQETENSLKKELDKLYERQNLGLDDNNSKIPLLEWKIQTLEDIDRNGHQTLNAPCEDYCNYLYENGKINEEENKTCNNKYILYAQDLLLNYIQMTKSYQDGTITKKEYTKLKNNILVKNKLVIEEVNKVSKLKEIPISKSCEDIQLDK